jgi:hypothetical protein
MNSASNPATTANTPSNCRATPCPRPTARPHPDPNRATNRGAQSCSTSGRTPNNSAANAWPRRWPCDCHYGKHFNPLPPCQKKLLRAISPATIDRLLADRKAAPRGLCGTRPGALLRQQIPLAGEVWDERRPGFLEVDRVAPGGGSLAGDFIWSLTHTCLGSRWTEGRAVWNQGYAGVLTPTMDLEARRPFALRGVDFDHGASGSTGLWCATGRNAWSR